MLRVILLLLCAFQPLFSASSLSKTGRSLQTKFRRDKVKSPEIKTCVPEVETPNGVGDLNLSDLSNSAKTIGVEIESPFSQRDTKVSNNPRGFSSLCGVNPFATRVCGTPLEDLFDKFPSNDKFYPIPTKTTVPSPLMTRYRSSNKLEEEEEEEVLSGYEGEECESEYDYSEDEDIILDVESRRNDDLNTFYENEERIASSLINSSMRTTDKESSPITVTVSLNQDSNLPENVTSNILQDVTCEDIDSDDSEYIEENVKHLDSSAFEMNLGSPSPREVKVVHTTSNTITGAPSVAVEPARVGCIQNVDIMKYRSIDSVLKMNLRERVSLTISLKNQIEKSENFESPIKFADIPQGVFMHKISVSVRALRKTLLTREEMENSNALINAIGGCQLNLNQWFQFIELLKRADREYASDEIMSKSIIPHIIEQLSKFDEAGQEKFERDILAKLAISGYILVLNDLLKHSIVGKSLRSHLDLYDIYILLATLTKNGTISDNEIKEIMELLLKGYDFEEFKGSNLGKELVKLCETNRKGLI